jgi:hypothetical protein
VIKNWIGEYPDVFGGAACLSTHWIGSLQREYESIPKAFNSYLEQHLPDPPNITGSILTMETLRSTAYIQDGRR